MARARVATLIAGIGLLGAVFPAGVVGVLDPLPHVSQATPVRPIGAVYLLAGGLVAGSVHADRPNDTKYVLGVVVACAIGLWIVFRWSSYAPDLVFFAPTLCILLPFTVGSADSAESVGLSAAAVLLLIVAAMDVYEPSVANAAGELTIVFFAGLWAVFGVPLYAVGREWRARVSKGDDRPDGATA